ncbi:hypothetical protein POM88_000426 [Heracleum sosnowskyi]|uniref:Pectin acetylesterase n=1 Tax=Heracleum sosnowskyi TaxID=360622 RepID=A0AAD8JBV1_9APIA|nr:hypothetical protein POM88_000426 [Heracleum sosnowskyi]
MFKARADDGQVQPVRQHMASHFCLELLLHRKLMHLQHGKIAVQHLKIGKRPMVLQTRNIRELDYLGGGWCNAIASCSYRKTTALGSSKYMGHEVKFAEILSSDPSKNPDEPNAEHSMSIHVMGDGSDEEDDVTNIFDDEGDVEADCEGNTYAMEGACAMEDAEGDLEGGDGESEGEGSDSEED